MSTIGDLVINLRADIASFRDAMEEAKKGVSSLSETVEDAKKIFETYIAGDLVNRLRDFVSEHVEALAKIQETASTLGVSAESYQALGFAAQQAGVDHQSLNAAVGFFEKTLGQAMAGVGQGAKAFAELGISQKQARDLGSLPLEEAIGQIADRIKEARDPFTLAAEAALVFGRNWQSAAGVLLEGSAGLDSTTAKARQLGVVLSNEDVQAAKEAADELKVLSAVIEADLGRFVIAILPELRSFANILTEAAQGISIIQNGGGIVPDLTGETRDQLAKQLSIVEDTLKRERDKLKEDLGPSNLGVHPFKVDTSDREALIKQLELEQRAIQEAWVKAGQPPHAPPSTGGGLVAPAKPDPLKALDDEIAKTREQVAVLAVEHDQRNQIMRVQEEQRALEEYRGKATAGVIIAKADELAALKEQLPIVQAIAKSEDDIANLRAQTALVNAGGDRGLAAQLEVEKVLREANISATDRQSAAMQKLSADTREHVAQQFALKDAQADKSLTDQIQSLIDEGRVLQLNHGYLADEIAAREQLATQLKVEEDLRKSGLSVASAEGQRRAALIEQIDAQTRANEALKEGQQVYDQTRSAGEQYAAQISKLNDLLNQGAIDWQTYTRGVDDAQSKLAGVPNSIDAARDLVKDASDLITKSLEDMSKAFETSRNRGEAFRKVLVDLVNSAEQLVLNKVILPQLEKGLDVALFGGGARTENGPGSRNLFGAPAAASSPGSSADGTIASLRLASAPTGLVPVYIAAVAPDANIVTNPAGPPPGSPASVAGAVNPPSAATLNSTFPGNPSVESIAPSTSAASDAITSGLRGATEGLRSGGPAGALAGGGLGIVNSLARSLTSSIGSGGLSDWIGSLGDTGGDVYSGGFFDDLAGSLEGDSGSFSGLLGDIGSGASSLLSDIGSIIPFADGGVVDSPTIGMIGEKGREYVLPEATMRKIAGAREAMNAQRAASSGPATINLGGIHVQSNDPNAFRRSSGQMMQEVFRHLNQASRYR